MRALLCTRQSRSRAVQLVTFDSGYAVSAGCNASLVFLTMSARDPARHGLAYAHASRACQANRWRARTQSCTFGCRGRRAGFVDHGREWHCILGLLVADCAEDSLAASQLGFATGDARRILGCHLGVADDTERGQHHEDRGAAPAANKRWACSNDRKAIDLRRSTDAV